MGQLAKEGRIRPAYWLQLVLVGALMFVACGDDGERHVYEDQGTLCLRTNNGDLLATLSLPGCLSASCDTDREAECTLLVVGDRVRIDSHFAYTRRSGSCTLDCGSLATQCSAPVPPSGSYPVDIGERTNVFTLSIADGTIEGRTEGDCTGMF